MVKFCFFLFCLVMAAPGFSQKKLRNLQKQIQPLVESLHGVAGYYIEDLQSGKSIGYFEDSVFPTASIIKIPIMIGVMDKIKSGGLEYHQSVTYKDSLLYPGVDLLGSFKEGETIEISKLLLLMLSLSDNTASLWLQSLCGGGTRINEILDENGLIQTKVNSRTPNRQASQKLFGWGQTTPKEMADLFIMIYRNKILNQTSSQKMLRMLGRNYWDEEALSEIPAGVFVASKSGAVDASRSEILLVLGKHPYVLSVFTKNNADKSWETSNEAWEMTRKISAMAWAHFSR